MKTQKLIKIYKQRIPDDIERLVILICKEEGIEYKNLTSFSYEYIMAQGDHIIIFNINEKKYNYKLKK